MNRLIIIVISLFFLNHCSFNESSRIWKDKEKKIENQKKIKKLFAQEKKIITEFNPELKLDLSKLKLNSYIVNDKNNFGAQNYSGLNQKNSSYKFSKIENPSHLN